MRRGSLTTVRKLCRCALLVCCSTARLAIELLSEKQLLASSLAACAWSPGAQVLHEVGGGVLVEAGRMAHKLLVQVFHAIALRLEPPRLLQHPPVAQRACSGGTCMLRNPNQMLCLSALIQRPHWRHHYEYMQMLLKIKD